MTPIHIRLIGNSFCLLVPPSARGRLAASGRGVLRTAISLRAEAERLRNCRYQAKRRGSTIRLLLLKLGVDVEGGRMPEERVPNPEQDPAQAAAHVASAHEILNALQEKIGEHPELAAAINKLEMALSILAVQTGGLI